MREYFSKVMQGKEPSLQEVVLKDRGSNASKHSDLDFEGCWKSLPSPTDVMHTKLFANSNKDTGENCVAGKTDKTLPRFDRLFCCSLLNRDKLEPIFIEYLKLNHFYVQQAIFKVSRPLRRENEL